MRRLSASQLAHHIMQSIAEGILLGTGTDASEIGLLTRTLMVKPHNQEALRNLGLAARKAQRNQDLDQARQEFQQTLEGETLKHLVEVSRELRVLLNKGLEGNDAEFRAMIKQLAVLKG